MKHIALFCIALLTAVSLAAETPPRFAMSDARSKPLLCAKYMASKSSQEFCCGFLFNAFARQCSDSGLFIKAADFGLAAAEIVRGTCPHVPVLIQYGADVDICRPQEITVA